MPTNPAKLSRLKALATLVCGFDYPPHFDEWEQLVQKHDRLLIVASRDHGKTSFFSKLFVLYELITKPGIEILIISYAENQVIKIITGIKDFVESKEGLNTLKPRSEENWSRTALKLSNGSRLESGTFGSAMRGGHFDLVIVDDPVRDERGPEPEMQLDYFNRAIVPMVKPSGKMIVVGNFIYIGDLVESLEKNPAYEVGIYPAINERGEALWPQRWPIPALEKRRIEIGEYAFAKEYLLQKISLGTQFFKRSQFQYYDSVPERLFRLLSVDPAISTEGDFTAICVTGTDEKNKTYLLEYANIRTDNIQQIIDEIFRMVQTHCVPYIQIETIGFQKLLKHWLYEAMREKNYHFGIEEITHHAKSKEARIMALQPRIAAGSLLFHPTKHEEVINQFLAFPRGLHDDLCDSLAMQIGKWDQPGPIEEKRPYNSFAWWREQIKPVNQDWVNALNP